MQQKSCLTVEVPRRERVQVFIYDPGLRLSVFVSLIPPHAHEKKQNKNKPICFSVNVVRRRASCLNPGGGGGVNPRDITKGKISKTFLTAAVRYARVQAAAGRSHLIPDDISAQHGTLHAAKPKTWNWYQSGDEDVGSGSLQVRVFNAAAQRAGPMQIHSIYFGWR